MHAEHRRKGDASDGNFIVKATTASEWASYALMVATLRGLGFGAGLRVATVINISYKRVRVGQD